MADKRPKAPGRGGYIGLFVPVTVTALIFVAVFIILIGMNKKDTMPGRVAAATAAALGNDVQYRERFSADVASKGDAFFDPGRLIGLTPQNVADQMQLKPDADLMQSVASGAVTDEFKLYSDGGVLYVRAINVYMAPLSLKDCCICSVRFSGDSGVYSLAERFSCGDSSLSDVRGHYIERSLYLATDDTLIYKTNNENIRFFEKRSTTGRSTYPVIAGANEVDGIFRFENGTLSSYRLEAPELLYYSLRNNVDQYELEQMSPEELAALRRQRDHYLEELKEAFDAAGVDVVIDDTDGTVAMKSDVLFDFDSYAIREDAKRYLDEFFDIYMSVLMREDISSSVYSVRFEGHTDTKGSYDYNKTLSLKRAQSVLDYCVKRSALDEDKKAELARLAEAYGYSFDHPVYAADGSVDMPASRRVEINFVIGTKYRLSEEQERALNGEYITTVSASSVFKGNSFVPAQYTIAKLTDDYSSDPEIGAYELLSADSMCLFVGDKIRIGGLGNPGISRFELSDPSVGRTSTEVFSMSAGRETEYYFFEARKSGTCRIDAYAPREGYEGSDMEAHATLHVFEVQDDLPLSLKPEKDSFRKGDNVKFILSGEYEGDIWACVYLNGERRGSLYDKAEWLDPTTLSVDITGEADLTVILIPAGDPDTLLGYYKEGAAR